MFERFFEQLARNSSASYGMIRADGAVLARYPFAAKPGIVLAEDSGFRRMVSSNPAGGRYTSVSGVDGIERSFEIRRLGDLPLYVTSSLQAEAVTTEWVEWIALNLGFGIPLLCALLALEYVALRRTNELYDEATRRQEVENTVRQSQKMEAVGQLTGGIAHDFNNLLTIILGNLQMALRQSSEGKPKTQISNAYQAAGRAAELTKRLLAFSRSQPLDPHPLDANRLVAGMSDLLDRTLGETIAVETVRSAGLWLTEADAPQL